jgi:hypothetical protein
MKIPLFTADYFLNVNDRIDEVMELDCVCDDEAELVANRLLAERPYHHAVEVWQRRRCVSRHPKASAVTISN